MPFQPGVAANPNGRPVGSRNKRSEALWAELDADPNNIDPARYLNSKVSDPNAPPELRLQAATALLPYKYSKCGSIVPLRFIEEPVELPFPSPKDLDQVRQNIDYISNLVAQGQLDLDFANRLNADQQIIGNLMIEDTKLERLNPDPNKPILVTGGLPSMPGTSILPGDSQLNGHGMNGHNGHPVLEHEPVTDSVNGQNDSASLTALLLALC